MFDSFLQQNPDSFAAIFYLSQTEGIKPLTVMNMIEQWTSGPLASQPGVLGDLNLGATRQTTIYSLPSYHLACEKNFIVNEPAAVMLLLTVNISLKSQVDHWSTALKFITVSK